MSDFRFQHEISDNRIVVRLAQADQGIISRLLSRAAAGRASFSDLPSDQINILYAIGDLRAWSDQHPDEVEISDQSISMSHDAVANLSTSSAKVLGLPEDVDLTLHTDVEGTVGRPDFRLRYEWSRHGRRELPIRQGAILNTSNGHRRIPLWMKRALDLADGFVPTGAVDEQWKVLADFRRTLEPEEADLDEGVSSSQVQNLSMTSFLRRLNIKIANSFSIAPDRTLGNFEILPFSSDALDENLDDVSETDAELSGEELAEFQHKVGVLGARSAYQLRNNSYLVVDPSSAPALQTMAEIKRHGVREERREFIRNPRAYIQRAVEKHLEESGAFEGLDDSEREELTERSAQPTFIETREYSDRVTGVVEYLRPQTDRDSVGTSWLPEVFPGPVSKTLQEMPTQQLEELRDNMRQLAETQERPEITIGGETVEITPQRISAVESELSARAEIEAEKVAGAEETPESGRKAPLILDVEDNFESVSWRAELKPRSTRISVEVPLSVTTRLREHQLASFRWATDAWQSGLPGILNADEQGLGKTLQTISMLNWLQSNMEAADTNQRRPVLVVAPTSLLRNWEEEVERHVAPRKFGHLIRLYGSSLSSHKRIGASGFDTQSGLPQLNFDWLNDDIAEGRGHKYWFLTTYTTLANYQHSLGRIRFSAMVFDEIQNVKNKDTLASRAVEAMNADFRIGLTGTPIENSTMDLWTIMDRLVPGSLGAGSEFKQIYRDPTPENMAQLYSEVFEPKENVPPLALRRLKSEVARDLPAKSRYLHPKRMPDVQAQTYDVARTKLAAGGPGAALKMLHHIRSVSVHPSASQTGDPAAFVDMSARLQAVMDILTRIKTKNERALVFIEHREIQFRFAELAKHFFGLRQIDIINGDTAIPKRQSIVRQFQSHLDEDRGFDILILGPKAAGTGLTLTAATHVIHLSRWWNPAVEEQCNDRVHRIGQTKPVSVHVPIAIHPDYRENSFDCLLQSLMQRKRKMAQQALWPMGDTNDDMSNLAHGMDAGASNSSGELLSASIDATMRRDDLSYSGPDETGAYQLDD